MLKDNVLELWFICQQLPLEKKRQPSPNIINARCPICGDSKKNPNKRRFYLLYEPQLDKITAYCHNCGYVALRRKTHSPKPWDFGREFIIKFNFTQ